MKTISPDDLQQACGGLSRWDSPFGSNSWSPRSGGYTDPDNFGWDPWDRDCAGNCGGLHNGIDLDYEEDYQEVDWG